MSNTDLPVFGQQPALKDEDFPVSRKEVMYYVANYAETILKPQFEAIQRKIGAIEAFIAYLEEIGLSVSGDHVKLDFQEVAKWGESIKNRAAQKEN